MSLTVLSGKIAKLSQSFPNAMQGAGTNIIGGITGENSFLRNEDTSIGRTLSNLTSGARSTLDVFSLAGIRQPEYVIGKIDSKEEQDISSSMGIWNKGIAGTVARAVSSIKSNGQEKGVIIDGFDNIKGESKVALPSQPVMYRPDMNNNRVPQPDVLTMRVYVSNEYTDDIFDNLIESAKNAFNGLGNLVFGSEQTRTQRALSNLKWIERYGKPFKVYTTHGVYENMLIKSLVPTNDKTTNDLLTVDITFQEIILTQSLEQGAKSPARSEPSAIVNGFAQKCSWIKSLI
jgi:hypothetical protein